MLMSPATFLVTLYISLMEHLHPHKHIYNIQTYKIMNEHIHMVNFDNKMQRTRIKQSEIPDLKFCKTYVCQED